MTQIFNTNFEVSRRLLLLLSAFNRDLDIDVISILDLITTYSKNYDLGDINLHGDNKLSFSEITARRQLTLQALKDLAFKNLIDVTVSADGFIYKINNNGLSLCKTMTSIYSIEYLREAKKLNEKLGNKTNQEIINFANKYNTKRRIKYE